MQVNLYYTPDDEHKLHKTLTSIHNCVGSLKDECSLIDPVILLETAEATACRANYMEITDLDITRYYFIQDWKMYRDGLVEVHATLDPLMTYETQIRALECTIARNENEIREKQQLLQSLNKDITELAKQNREIKGRA